MNYRMQLPCGHAIYRGAASQDEAIEKFRQLLTQEMVDEHYAKNHARDQRPSLDEVISAMEGSVRKDVDAWSIPLPPVKAKS